MLLFRINLILFLFLFVLFTNTSLAHDVPNHDIAVENNSHNLSEPIFHSTETLEKYLHLLMDKQGVSTFQDIDVDKISEADLEMLGDVLLELTNPGKAHVELHKQNGGEGSEQLKQFHINVAKNYLQSKYNQADVESEIYLLDTDLQDDVL